MQMQFYFILFLMVTDGAKFDSIVHTDMLISDC